MRNILTFILILALIIPNIGLVYSNYDWKRVSYLIKYVDSKISDIKKIVKKYSLQDDNEIKSRIRKLREIKRILTETEKSWKYKNYTQKLIEQLKENNELIKKQLKQKIEQKKIEAKKYSILYYEKIKPRIKKIDNILILIAKKLIEKDKFNKKDKKIIWVLISIKQKLEELDSITNKKWKSKEDIRLNISYNFRQMKDSFDSLKDIIR